MERPSIEMAMITDHETGQITAYCLNIPGGPIVTASTIEEVTDEFNKAMSVHRCVMHLLLISRRSN